MLLEGYEGLTNGFCCHSRVKGTPIIWSYRAWNHDNRGGHVVTNRDAADHITLEYGHSGVVQLARRLTATQRCVAQNIADEMTVVVGTSA